MFILPPNCIVPSATSLTISPVFPNFRYFISHTPSAANEIAIGVVEPEFQPRHRLARIERPPCPTPAHRLHRVAAAGNCQPATPSNIASGGRRRDYVAVRNCFICNAEAVFSTGRQGRLCDQGELALKLRRKPA